ncbi:Protein of unknown function [Formivibrio citricus]|uniref:Uncharacterized protein n=1 Tax=Formivibrio citricus TaxID=83765 RepID=A0A1I5A155_9NEIS|nr:DUF3237 domain-containing protein [Formivibrio citricus]SFN56090.1 Protein of unknown function [Formivibrio citricus]
MSKEQGMREKGMDRRSLLLGGVGLAVAAGSLSAAEPVASKVKTPTSDRIPMYLPRTEFVLEAIVDIGRNSALGNGPLGERRMVEITGGTFEGPGLRGKVIPYGGMDRQLIRRDGIKRMDALYELQTDDGAVLTIRNQVIVDDGKKPRYAFSAVEISAPDGPYAWLNRVQLVGMHAGSLRPERQAVVIRVYKLV